MLVTYDTMDDDDAKFGVGLGCNGIIQVLIEPIDDQDTLNPIELLKEITRLRKESVLVTFFNLRDRKSDQAGTCIIYRDEEDQLRNSTILPPTIGEDIKNSLTRKKSAFKAYDLAASTITAFIEYVELPVALMIIGLSLIHI